VELSPMRTGLVAAVISAVSFGTSGAFVKPLLEEGWSPAAAVTARALTAAAVLSPFVLAALRGRWAALWRARRQVLGMGAIAVAFTQFAYFFAVQRVPVSTALLVEYLGPFLLVGFTWATTRRTPGPAVFVGSALAIGGLVLVIGPGALQPVDPVGLAAAFAAAIGNATYFAVAARPVDGVPPVALAGVGLVVGGLLLGLVGATGLLPFSAAFHDVLLFGHTMPWWIPLLVIGVFGTAIAYATGIAASRKLGSRLASFVGLLELLSAAVFAWLVLGEALTVIQLAGATLILGGIVAVRASGAQDPGAVADRSGTGTVVAGRRQTPTPTPATAPDAAVCSAAAPD
jgi:drug/metabolite transporter (DMT)-like permease